MRKRLIYRISERRVRSKRYFGVPFYLKTLPSVDINAFPAIDINKFESPQSFDFHSLLILQGLFYQEKELFDECFGILLGHAMFSRQ